MKPNYIQAGQIISMRLQAKANKIELLIRGNYDITGTISSNAKLRKDLWCSDIVLVTGNYDDFDFDEEGHMTGFSISNAMLRSRIPLKNVYVTSRKSTATE